MEHEKPVLNILTEREREIAQLVATGAANKQIARQLSLNVKTVKNMLTKVYMKTNTRSRTELAVRVVRSELLAPVNQDRLPGE